jgi:hypothetical protein
MTYARRIYILLTLHDRKTTINHLLTNTVYAAFEAVKVEDKVIKEAERFKINLVSSIKSYFVTSTLACRQDLLFIVYI